MKKKKIIHGLCFCIFCIAFLGSIQTNAATKTTNITIPYIRVTSNNWVKIKWQQIDGAKKYNVYRMKYGQTQYKKIASVSNALLYTDKRSAKSTSTYQYKIIAEVVNDKKKMTKVASKTVVVKAYKKYNPGYAKSFKVKRVLNKVTLSWTKQVNVKRYEICSIDDKDNTKLIKVSGTKCSYTYLAEWKKYVYQIKVIRKYDSGIIPVYYSGDYSSKKSLNIAVEDIAEGKYYLGEKMGFSRNNLVKHLTAHVNDRYYLGTPYCGLWNSRMYKYCIAPNGGEKNPSGRHSMNCTGFVACAITNVGGQISSISNYRGGKEANAWNWQDYIEAKKVKRYIFKTIEELLGSGLAEKGDVIMSVPTSDYLGRDWHVGFFWGNKSSSNVFWHSLGANVKYGKDKYTVDGNQITNIIPGTYPTQFWLIKID